MARRCVCDQETSKTRRLKPATGLWKIQPQWVVTPRKQTNKLRREDQRQKQTTNTTVTAVGLRCSSLYTKHGD
jgi:hypothetical protein